MVTQPPKPIRVGQHELPLELLRTDGDTQMRADPIDEEHVEYLAEVYKAGGSVRSVVPLVAFFDGESLWLADGFHRLAALQRLGEVEAWVDVRRGSLQQARVYACSANARHGKRPSLADRRKAVLYLLQDPEYLDERGRKPSHREIGRATGASHWLVNKVAAELEAATSGRTSTSPPQPEQTSSAEVTDRDPEPPAEPERPAGREPLSMTDSNVYTLLSLYLLESKRAGLSRLGLVAVLNRLELRAGQRIPDALWMAVITRGVREGKWKHDGVISAGEIVRGCIWLIEGGGAAEAHRPHGSDQAPGRIAPEILGSTPGPHHSAELDLDDPAVQGHLAAEEAPEDDDTSDELEDLEEDPDRSDDDPELDPDLEHDLILIRSALTKLEAGASGSPWREETVLEKFLELAEYDEIDPAVWEGRLEEGAARSWWRRSGGSLRLLQGELVTAKPRPTAMPPDEPTPTEDQPRKRAKFDAYYTPRPVARACIRYLIEQRIIDASKPGMAVEPAVGAGAWADEMYELLPHWLVDRVDINPQAVGLQAPRCGEMAVAIDWRTEVHPDNGKWGHRISLGWDLCLGNRPYRDKLQEWVEVSLRRSPIVAYLERQTITGPLERARWFADGHRPTHIVQVEPRPEWEGPGAYEEPDFVGSVLIVWQRGRLDGPTLFDWIFAEVTP